jgi:hypothetical protein
MNPVVMYECHACGQSFSSELWLRYHDSVCIPRNLPAADTVPAWTLSSPAVFFVVRPSVVPVCLG